ncbi:MAG: hypothetical protein Alpg2KO_23090 [Alphaproteobacteria bacterium]
MSEQPDTNGQDGNVPAESDKSRRGILIIGLIVLALGALALREAADQLSSSLQGLSRPLDAQPETLIQQQGPIIAPLADTWADIQDGVLRIPLQIYGVDNIPNGDAVLSLHSSATTTLPQSSLAVSGQPNDSPALLIDLSNARPGKSIITVSLQANGQGRNDRNFILHVGQSGRYNSLPERTYKGLIPPMRAVAADTSRICGLLRGELGVRCWQDSEIAPPAGAPPGIAERPTQLGILDGALCSLGAGERVLACEGRSYKVRTGSTIRSFAVSSHARHACAITQDGAAWCAGDNATGALGTGSIDSTDEMTAVSAGQGPSNDKGQLFDLRQISVGSGFSCAVTRAGAALCWGSNDHGQLSTTPSRGQPTPLRVTRTQALGAGNVSQIAAGRSHVCALTKLAEVYCWGDNTLGQLGRPTTSATPDHLPLAVSSVTDADSSSRIVELYAAGDATCVRRIEGEVDCWGQLEGPDGLAFGPVPKRILPSGKTQSLYLSPDRLSWLEPLNQ